MVFSCFAMYVLANNTWVVPYLTNSKRGKQWNITWPRLAVHVLAHNTQCVLNKFNQFRPIKFLVDEEKNMHYMYIWISNKSMPMSEVQCCNGNVWSLETLQIKAMVVKAHTLLWIKFWGIKRGKSYYFFIADPDFERKMLKIIRSPVEIYCL